jgi:hypothetical protein
VIFDQCAYSEQLIPGSFPMAEYASGHLLFVRDQILMAQPFNPNSLIQ